MDIPISIKAFLKETNQENIFYGEYTFPKTKDINQLRSIARSLFIEKICQFYDSKNIDVNSAIYNFLIEPLKNGNFYSDNKQSPLEIGLILSKNALVTSCIDGGSYFTREDIKTAWESKQVHPEKTQSEEKQIGYGLGKKIIYEMSDLILVETQLNKLFLGLSTKGKFFNLKTKQTTSK